MGSAGAIVLLLIGVWLIVRTVAGGLVNKLLNLGK